MMYLDLLSFFCPSPFFWLFQIIRNSHSLPGCHKGHTCKAAFIAFVSNKLKLKMQHRHMLISPSEVAHMISSSCSFKHQADTEKTKAFIWSCVSGHNTTVVFPLLLLAQFWSRSYFLRDVSGSSAATCSPASHSFCLRAIWCLAGGIQWAFLQEMQPAASWKQGWSELWDWTQQYSFGP